MTGRKLVTLISGATLLFFASGIQTQAARTPKTAAYVHVASAASSCALDSSFNVLEHPLANGNRNVVILVGIDEGASASFGGVTAVGAVSVFYDDAGLCATNRWVLITRDSAIPLGQRFHVFIAAP